MDVTTTCKILSPVVVLDPHGANCTKKYLFEFNERNIHPSGHDNLFQRERKGKICH